MTKNKTPSNDKPKPAETKIDVVNPRYEGATVEMVVKAMLQRPRKDDDKGITKPAATANTKKG